MYDSLVFNSNVKERCQTVDNQCKLILFLLRDLFSIAEELLLLSSDEGDDEIFFSVFFYSSIFWLRKFVSFLSIFNRTQEKKTQKRIKLHCVSLATRKRGKEGFLIQKKDSNKTFPSVNVIYFTLREGGLLLSGKNIFFLLMLRYKHTPTDTAYPMVSFIKPFHEILSDSCSNILFLHFHSFEGL